MRDLVHAREDPVVGQPMQRLAAKDHGAVVRHPRLDVDPTLRARRAVPHVQAGRATALRDECDQADV